MDVSRAVQLTIVIVYENDQNSCSARFDDCHLYQKRLCLMKAQCSLGAYLCPHLWNEEVDVFVKDEKRRTRTLRALCTLALSSR